MSLDKKCPNCTGNIDEKIMLSTVQVLLIASLVVVLICLFIWFEIFVLKTSNGGSTKFTLFIFVAAMVGANRLYRKYLRKNRLLAYECSKCHHQMNIEDF